MKLLFDQNISFRLVEKLKDIFPKCTQVRLVGLENATDYKIRKFAKQHGYAIVTFDADFYDIATLEGHPPKIIWLRLGNTSTSNLRRALTKHQNTIKEFLTSEQYKEISCLEISH